MQFTAPSARFPFFADVTHWRICLLVLAAFCLVSARVAAEEMTVAPDFALRSLEGQNLRLSEYRGEVVLLNFWAEWCGECRQAMAALEELHAKYQRAGLVLLSINIDDDARHVADVARSLKVTFPVLLDTRKETSRLYDVGTMPLSVLIDREGMVRYRHAGHQPGDEDEYLDQLRTLLKE